MKKILLAAMMVLALASCTGKSNRVADEAQDTSENSLKPNINGKAGEVLIVIEKNDWEGALGNDVRELLGGDCPYLVMKEPLFTLLNVDRKGFDNIFVLHRNIVCFQIDPACSEGTVLFERNKWAKPQCVVDIVAKDAQEASALLRKNIKGIVNAIEQAERNRIISTAHRYEVKELSARVNAIFGGFMYLPNGYEYRKSTEDFIWIGDEKYYTNQGILVYRFPARGDASDFTLANLISHRNEILKENVPGPRDNTYMTTGRSIEPTGEKLLFPDREVTQVRGYWDVENDYMGGPFVSHSFYSKDKKYVITAEAFVYAPKFDKRQYLRQVESLLYSWEWSKK